MERAQESVAEPQPPLLGLLSANCLFCGSPSVEPWGGLNLFILCAHSDTQNHTHFPLRTAERHAGNTSLSKGLTQHLILLSTTTQQNIPMDFSRPYQMGKKEGWANMQEFFFCFVLSYYSLLFTSYFSVNLTSKQSKQT